LALFDTGCKDFQIDKQWGTALLCPVLTEDFEKRQIHPGDVFTPTQPPSRWRERFWGIVEAIYLVQLGGNMVRD
jgi:hypothetical protein